MLAYSRGTSLTLLAPLVFAGVVAVFAVEGGHLSRLLRCRFLLLLGALSYSIYMTHMFVLLRVTNVARASDKFLGTSFLQHVGHTDRYGDGIDAGSLLAGDMLMAAVVVGLVIRRLALPVVALTRGGFELTIEGDGPAYQLPSRWSLAGDARIVAHGTLTLEAAALPPRPAW